eukprot:13754102-Alexandrium_andersonii.AAC.1
MNCLSFAVRLGGGWVACPGLWPTWSHAAILAQGQRKGAGGPFGLSPKSILAPFLGRRGTHRGREGHLHLCGNGGCLLWDRGGPLKP